MALEFGTQPGHYEITDQIGKVAMGPLEGPDPHGTVDPRLPEACFAHPSGARDQ